MMLAGDRSAGQPPSEKTRRDARRAEDRAAGFTRLRESQKTPGIYRAAPWQDQSDAGLLRACVEGDQGAWNELVDRYGRLVYSIPRRYGFSVQAAEAVFQGVFAALLAQLERLPEPVHLPTWLIETAHRECVQRLPAGWSRPEWAHGAREAAPPHEVARRWERQQALRHALRQIDPHCQELLMSLLSGGETPGPQESRRELAPPISGWPRARCFERLEAVLDALGIELGDE
ncbi:MAG TPA: sigma-70 family RNA polymerase sigma factor [Ardenticatenaceae bacterium]|nr:sigma-70 family RNA polymerase sigma factor [Ardenticatenaceae bacterium]